MKKKDDSSDPAETKAREILEKDKPKLVAIFGADYENDSRFKDAVGAVKSGRTARLVLADYTDKTLPNDQITDGGGWAW